MGIAGTKRINSIDILRALAIILMVQCHFVMNLSTWKYIQVSLYDLSMILGSIPAPLFTFLVGASLWVSLNRRRASGLEEKQIAKQTMLRASLIFVGGLVFNLVIWGVTYIFDWDILTLIGTAIALVYLASFLPGRASILLCVAILALSPWLRELSNYIASWTSAYGVFVEYIPRWNLQDILRGWVLNGYFPLMPWLVFPLSGYLSASHLLGAEAGFRKSRAKVVLAIGLVLIALGTAARMAWFTLDLHGPIAWYLSAWSFYPAGTSFVLLTLGICQTGFAGLWLVLDSDAETQSKIRQKHWMVFFNRYSRYSLTTYVVHHAAHLWPMYVAGLLHGYIWYFWEDWVTPAEGLLLAAGFIAAFYGVMLLLDRSKGRYSLEGLLSTILRKRG